MAEDYLKFYYTGEHDREKGFCIDVDTSHPKLRQIEEEVEDAAEEYIAWSWEYFFFDYFRENEDELGLIMYEDISIDTDDDVVFFYNKLTRMECAQLPKMPKAAEKAITVIRYLIENKEEIYRFIKEHPDY